MHKDGDRPAAVAAKLAGDDCCVIFGIRNRRKLFAHIIGDQGSTILSVKIIKSHQDLTLAVRDASMCVRRSPASDADDQSGSQCDVVVWTSMSKPLLNVPRRCGEVGGRDAVDLGSLGPYQRNVAEFR
jgi:hypothetical protein